MRARVTLRGLVVEREAGREEVVAWILLRGRNGVFAEVGLDGERIGGWRDVLRTKDVREGRVAERLHERAVRRAFRDGTLEIRRSFRREIREGRFNSLIVGSMILTMVWLVIFRMGGAWYWRIGYLGASLLPFAAVWWVMIRPLPFYGARRVLSILVTPEMIHVERRDGSQDTYLFEDARRMELSSVPLIEFRDGTIVRVPGHKDIRAVLKLIQAERFPEAAQGEKRSLHRSLVRSCVYFMLGGAVAGVLTWWLQGQGLIPASRWRPLGVAMGLGIGMPGTLALSFVFQNWTTSGVPPWKKKAWREMFR